MQQRNLFSQVHLFFSDTREKIRLYAEKYPERVIAAMFFILLIAVTTFLITKALRKESRSTSASDLFSRVGKPSARVPEKQSSANIIDLLSLYGKTKSINPDSLTLKDSLLIKEINQDLKNILNEKD
jgi:hypothetical protein